MIDAHAALRSHLIAASPLRTLLGGDFVFVPEIPASYTGLTMPAKAIAFRSAGGSTYPYLSAQELRVSFRCYGATVLEAIEVYRALYDRLHAAQNFIVGDVGFHGAIEQVPGQPLEDRGAGSSGGSTATSWPFVFAVYTMWVATVSVA